LSWRNEKSSIRIKESCISGIYSRRSRVQRFRGSRLHPRPWTAFGMRICEKSVSFVRANRKFETKLAIIWENGHCKRWLRIFNAFFVLNPERWTLNLWTVIPPPRRNLIPTSRNSCLFDPPKRKADHFTMPTIRNQMKSVNFSTLLCNLYTGWAVQPALVRLIKSYYGPCQVPKYEYK
jgi:hypothetical protein